MHLSPALPGPSLAVRSQRLLSLTQANYIWTHIKIHDHGSKT